jgi:hypothetical protein
MSAWGPAAVYFLCLAASAVCAGLLLRAWRRARTRLLLFTALSFALFAVNNLFLVADMVVYADIDFRLWRQATAAAALGVLLWGFIWETK